MWPLPWGSQGPWWCGKKKGQLCWKGPGEHRIQVVFLDFTICSFSLIYIYFFNVCCWTNAEILAPLPSVSNSPYIQQVTPGECSRSGLTNILGWRHSEGSKALWTSPTAGSGLLLPPPCLFPALYLLPSDCLRKRKEMFSKKKFNETKYLYFELLTLDLCFSSPAIWDKSLIASLCPTV